MTTLKEKHKKILSRQKQVVSAEDVAQIKDEAESAKRLLQGDEFQFFRDYLRNVQKSITDIVVQNRLKTVRESTTDDTGVSREFETTKEEQLNELSGQYKLIETLFQDLTQIADLPEELERAKKTGKVDVVDSKDD